MKVVGNNILIIGDLHISDVFEGKHKNYLKNCFDVLGEIEEKVGEVNPSAIVLLGDIVGWSESNIRSREVLSQLCKWFMRVGVGRKIFCVRGNHDTKGYPEFQFLSDLKLFETATTCGGYFDYYGDESQEKPEVRFHLVDYGKEKEELQLAEDGVSNIVLGHNNYTIKGYTNWYQEHSGIELSGLHNFKGVDMVVSGHIHNPSPALYSTELDVGGNCALFYVGSPTRPIKDRNIYDSCWYLSFKYDRGTNSTIFDAVPFELKPVNEIFYAEEEFLVENQEEIEAEEIRTEALKEVLTEIMKYRISSNNLLESISNIPNATNEAKELASKYLQFALNTKQS